MKMCKCIPWSSSIELVSNKRFQQLWMNGSISGQHHTILDQEKGVRVSTQPTHIEECPIANCLPSLSDLLTEVVDGPRGKASSSQCSECE